MRGQLREWHYGNITLLDMFDIKNCPVGVYMIFDSGCTEHSYNFCWGGQNVELLSKDKIHSKCLTCCLLHCSGKM